MNSLPAETPNWRKKFDRTLNQTTFANPPNVKIGVEFCTRHNRWEERWTFQDVTLSQDLHHIVSRYKFASDEV